MHDLPNRSLYGCQFTQPAFLGSQALVSVFGKSTCTAMWLTYLISVQRNFLIWVNVGNNWKPVSQLRQRKYATPSGASTAGPIYCNPELYPLPFWPKIYIMWQCIFTSNLSRKLIQRWHIQSSYLFGKENFFFKIISIQTTTFFASSIWFWFTAINIQKDWLLTQTVHVHRYFLQLKPHFGLVTYFQLNL